MFVLCCICIMHSILHNGLLAASGTRLQTTGAVFGVGIYLSTDFSVAYSFSKAQQGWAGSSIGRHLRCVLLCQVAKEVAQQDNSQSNSSAQGNSRCDQQHDTTLDPQV
jgi:poly[ADP-ribose] polymerase 16